MWQEILEDDRASHGSPQGTHFRKSGAGIWQGSRTFLNLVRTLCSSLIFLPTPGRKKHIFLFKNCFSPLLIAMSTGQASEGYLIVLVQVLITNS